jgi:hypothetical protein
MPLCTTGGGYGIYRHFQQYFNYIVAVSFIGGGTRSTPRLSGIQVDVASDTWNQSECVLQKHVFYRKNVTKKWTQIGFAMMYCQK